MEKLQGHGQVPDDEAGLQFGELDAVLDVIQKLAWKWRKFWSRDPLLTYIELKCKTISNVRTKCLETVNAFLII